MPNQLANIIDAALDAPNPEQTLAALVARLKIRIPEDLVAEPRKIQAEIDAHRAQIDAASRANARAAFLRGDDTRERIEEAFAAKRAHHKTAAFSLGQASAAPCSAAAAVVSKELRAKADGINAARKKESESLGLPFRPSRVAGDLHAAADLADELAGRDTMSDCRHRLPWLTL